MRLRGRQLFACLLSISSCACLFCPGVSFAQHKKVVTRKSPVKAVIPVKPYKKIPGTRILLLTDSGQMVLRLYDSTPLHRDNFIAKVQEGFYDSLMFHRVIKNFMIQGGDPASRNAQPGDMLGMGSAPGDRIPAEFVPTLFHKKGALAAARDNNPEKASSNCQFYIVQGKKYTDAELDMFGTQKGISFSPDQRLTYKNAGGVPFLDQNYTVFGEVEMGLDVLDKIAGTLTAPGDRPVADIRMHMQVMTDEAFDAFRKDFLNKNKKVPPRKLPVKPLKKEKPVKR